MKIMYEVDDKVVMTRSKDGLLEGQIVRVVDTDYNTMHPYLVTDDNIDAWVEEDDIKFTTPAIDSLLSETNEIELKEYIKIKTEEDTKKCLEFLAKNSGEYFSLEEICKKAMISFSFIGTLQRELKKESENPFSCLNTDFYYRVSRILHPNKKVYFGDDGSILIRGKSEEYFNAVKVVREVYVDKDEEERDDNE